MHTTVVAHVLSGVFFALDGTSSVHLGQGGGCLTALSASSPCRVAETTASDRRRITALHQGPGPSKITAGARHFHGRLVYCSNRL